MKFNEKMKPFLKVLACVGVCMFLLAPSFCASKKKLTKKATIPAEPKEKIEHLKKSDGFKDVMVEGYSHPYAWNNIQGDKVKFKELWGYVMASRIKEYDKDTPLTDIGLFACEVDSYGDLVNVPKRSLVAGFSGRVHLVAVCESRSLTHFAISTQYDVREKLIRDLIKATEDFDGLQIDYELVPKKDAGYFHSFLRELKKRLGDKELTVCVPARLKTISDDVYSYKKIGEIADRIMIMAYDEHWSTSAPGAISSTKWCKKIANYALSIYPAEKYIMGLPFYGRTWAEKPVAQAWFFNGINRIMTENQVEEITRIDGIPSFEYTAQVKVTGFYDDAQSIVDRCRMYKGLGFETLAFWRMGQEDAAVWKWLETGE